MARSCAALRSHYGFAGIPVVSFAPRWTARVTHAEARAWWGTVAVNRAIAHLLNGGTITDAPAAAVVGIANSEVREAVLDAAKHQRDEVRAGGFVLETIGASFWSLLNSGSAREAIEMAVALGDDADSTGAVTGALAGAAYGVSALPTTWLETVQFRERLESEAARLLVLSEREQAAEA
jgi:ADP-ribosyl-[dinitrogen reductase] hydrolase